MLNIRFAGSAAASETDSYADLPTGGGGDEAFDFDRLEYAPASLAEHLQAQLHGASGPAGELARLIAELVEETGYLTVPLADRRAVAHDEVGAQANRHHRHVRIQAAHEDREILGILRLHQPLSRAAGLEPDEIGQAPAPLRLARKLRNVDDFAHRSALALAMPSAIFAAHLVMSPAPRQITMSPGAARSLSLRQTSSRSATA